MQNGLLAGLILFFSMFCQLVFCEPLLNEQDRAVAEIAKKLNENPYRKEDLLKFSTGDKYVELANKIYQDQASLVPEMDRSERYDGISVYVFISSSLGESQIEEAITSLAEDDRIAFVFRGVDVDKSIASGIAKIQRLATKYNPVPRIIIDPTLYRRYDITKVPTIVVADPKSRNSIVTVKGLVALRWLEEKVQQGNRGDLGVRGPVEEIAEPDLIEVMKKKWASLDHDAMKEKAKNRFWLNKEFPKIPAAQKDAVRLVDPTVVVTDDIKDSKGNIISKKGTVINPLDILPFNQSVIVFNSTDALQVKQAIQLYAEQTKKFDKVTLISSEFPKVEGWESYRKITDTFQAPVYMLTKDFKERFDLRVIPAVITANGRKFQVAEYRVSEE